MIAWRCGLEPTYRPSMGEYHFLLDREMVRVRREEETIRWQSEAVMAIVKRLDALGRRQ